MPELFGPAVDVALAVVMVVLACLTPAVPDGDRERRFRGPAPMHSRMSNSPKGIP
jgi:hypothetical protein